MLRSALPAWVAWTVMVLGLLVVQAGVILVYADKPGAYVAVGGFVVMGLGALLLPPRED